MNRHSFLLLFFVSHFAGIGLYIYKYNLKLQYSYQTQMLEKRYHDRYQRMQQLQKVYCMLQDSHTMREYAEEKLHMIPLCLQSIHRLPS